MSSPDNVEATPAQPSAALQVPTISPAQAAQPVPAASALPVASALQAVPLSEPVVPTIAPVPPVAAPASPAPAALAPEPVASVAAAAPVAPAPEAPASVQFEDARKESAAEAEALITIEVWQLGVLALGLLLVVSHFVAGTPLPAPSGLALKVVPALLFVLLLLLVKRRQSRQS